MLGAIVVVIIDLVGTRRYNRDIIYYYFKMSITRRDFLKFGAQVAGGLVGAAIGGGLESPANAQDNAVTEAFVNELRAKYVDLPQPLFGTIVERYNNPSLLEYAIGQVNAVYTQAPQIAEIFGANGENVEIITGENSLMLTFKPKGEEIFAITGDGYMLQSNGENPVGWTEAQSAMAISFPLHNGLLWSMGEANKETSDRTDDLLNPADSFYVGAVGNGDIDIEAFKYVSGQQAVQTTIASGEFGNDRPYGKYFDEGSPAFGYNGPQILVATEGVTTEALINGTVQWYGWDILMFKLAPKANDMLQTQVRMTNSAWDPTDAPFDATDEVYGGTLPLERDFRNNDEG